MPQPITSTNSRPAPIRRGDVLDYAGTGRAATVLELLPGGRVTLRVEGYHADGRPLLRISEDRVRDMRAWNRLGRADYEDGIYASAIHLAAAPASAAALEQQEAAA